MFSRASNQRAQRDLSKVWQSNLQGLTFPWLCPILYRAISPPRKTSTIAPTRPSRRPKLTQASLSKPELTNTRITQRNLASAADFVYDEHDGFDDVRENHVPFEASKADYQQHAKSNYRWPGLSIPSADPYASRPSPLIIKEISSTKAPQFRAVDGISGDLPEIMQTLRACFKIGRFGRAATLMRRLNEIYRSDTPQLLAAHNEYLRELVDRISYTKDQQLLKKLHKWFEVDLRGARVIPDATTYALMIKATLQELDPKKINRTIRRYMSLAAVAGMRDRMMETMLLLLNEQDIGRVTQIAPSQPPDEIVPETLESSASSPIQPSSTSVSDEAFVIKSTPQKGLGLSTLKEALSVFSEPQPVSIVENGDVKENENRNDLRFQRQQRLERNTYETAVNRWRQEAKLLQSYGVNSTLKSVPMGAIMWKWHENLVPLLKEEIRKCNEAEDKKTKNDADKERCLYGPFLQMLPVDKISTITILSIMTNMCRKGVDEGGVSLISSVVNVGRTVEEECLLDMIRKDGKNKNWQNIKSLDKLRRLHYMLKQKSIKHSPTELAGLNARRSEDFAWSQGIRVRVGAVLVSHLMDAAKMDVTGIDPGSGVESLESQPVFFHSYHYVKGKILGAIRLNKAMIAKLTTEPVHCALEKNLPMLVEPKPWVDFHNGAFLEHRVQAVRNKSYDEELLRYTMTAARNGDMSRVFAGLDVLARTPWRINRKVFEVMVAGWNSGEKLGKIPPEKLNIENPEEPPPSTDPLIRYRWMNKMKELERKRSSIKSQRCFLNFQLEVARAYLNETMYFPHNMDFRGRAYPMVPFLNHMNADPCRSLLNFADGKELGENGLRWLKIHLASLHGFDKASFDERQKFADDHLSEIYDSATNPLDGKQWWLKADDPWQCLGACIELKSALDTPDPRRFISHLPIHKDGTCNGLQHYAALGGDSLGAKQVNLEPGGRPSDIYSRVADMVTAKVAEDAADGNEIAILLQGNITRKVVKQTVMTNVYGVTFSGARDQVKRQLEQIITDFPNTKAVNKFMAASYVVGEIFHALSEMFTRAQEIQYWLGDCAKRISRTVTTEQIKNMRDQKSDSKSPYAKTVLGKKLPVKDEDLFTSAVIWTTPLNMPVVQPYRAGVRKSLFTNLQKININVPSPMGATHMRRQLQAFPPNFIHSLDATHMILTALKCNENGLTFAAVHDSFWTHASDVDTMNSIIRDAFIKMHSDDIIGRLRSEFVTRHRGCLQLVSINSKSALGRKLKEWRRKPIEKRHRRKIGELLMEHRRQELLTSEKAEERLEGESMITGAKIYEEFAGDVNAIETEDLDEVLIGKVPKSISKTKDEDADFQNSVDSTSGDDASIAETIIGPGEMLDDVELVETIKVPKTSKLKTWVWLPISFPPIPPKGDFDISKIKTSKYFFS